MYYRNSLNCKRRLEIEISNIETLWAEFAFPNSKPFLICTAYRPRNSASDWIDLFEEELSIAQSTGLEMIIMGDFNIDLKSNQNRKWQNLIQLFDLSQLMSQPTRVTETTSTIIHHIYTSNPDVIIECFVSHNVVSDHFPVCIIRKLNEAAKSEHITTSYRCFKLSNENAFKNDLSIDLINFNINSSNINDDISEWYNIVLNI